jgi:hypothetical protein
MDIIAGLAGLKTAVELTRDLRDAAKSGSLKSDGFAGRVAEIYDYIVDSKDAVAEAKDQIQELKSRLIALDDKNQIDDELMHDGYVYWRNHVDGGRSGPYCVFCWKKEDRLVPLTHILGTFDPYSHPSNRYDCVTHGQFLVPTGDAPRERPRPVSRNWRVGSWS